MKEDIDQTLQVLEAGDTILYPTDSVWGIGCDATNKEAIEKVYQITGREKSQGSVMLVDNPGRVERYVDEMPDVAWDLIDVANKPLTIIYSNAVNLPENLLSENGEIGIRVVQDKFCQQLITRFKRPIVFSPARLRNHPFPGNFREISEEVKNSAGYIVKHRQDEINKTSPAGIIKLGPLGEVEIIRE